MAVEGVAATRDVVEALMETLVDPRLPSKVSVYDPPTQDAHKSVATQMHAVVLLYNYYHRKQNPGLEFLDFASFRKLALILRPSLISFMKMIKESVLNDAEDQLSVTEKAIKDACQIAMSLDSSKNVPTVEGCSISKVAVLLIDSKKENCLLQFSAVTEGVWSLIEKEIVESSISQEILLAEGVHKKRKPNNEQASTDDSKFLQLGYNSVKDSTGIDSSGLVVLESHVVYSLSKEKSAAQFYMMQCPRSFKIHESVPLEFLVESLQGPLVEKFCDGWTTTVLVEYHHMLPYVGFISGWLSRKDLCLPTSNGNNARITMSYDEKELPPRNIPSSPLSTYTGEDLDHINTNSSDENISSSNKVANGNSEYQQKKRRLLSGGKNASPVNVFQSINNNENALLEEFENRCGILNSEKHERGSLSDPSRGLSQTIVGDDNATRRMNTSDFTRSSSKSEESKNLNSKIGVYNEMKNNISCAQHDANGPEEHNLEVEMANLLKSNSSLSKDEKITAENGDATIPCNRSRTTENAPDKFEPLYDIEVGNTQASEDLQNALALLNKKRQDLYSQICTMEDELAVHEYYVEQIRDGEVCLARMCIKSILSGGDLSLLLRDKGHCQSGEDHSNSQSEKKTKFSCTFILGQSSCQDLEYICLKNNWRLPRYLVQPSDSKFVSSVVVESKDFDLHTKGGSESSPSKARESAAAQMIVELRNGCESIRD